MAFSEMDMRFRGPGEVLGSRQSGLPDFTLKFGGRPRGFGSAEAAQKVIAKDALLAVVAGGVEGIGRGG